MQKRLVRKARERNGNDDGNREAQEPPLAVERSHGRRQRWEYQAGSIWMHHSSRAGSGGSRAGSGGLVQGSADRCMSHPCHPPLSKIYAGILGLHCNVCPKRCPLVFPSLPPHIQVALVTIFAGLGVTAKLALISV